MHAIVNGVDLLAKQLQPVTEGLLSQLMHVINNC